MLDNLLNLLVKSYIVKRHENDSFSPSLPLLDLPVAFLADGGAQPGCVSSGIGHIRGQTLYTCDNELE